MFPGSLLACIVSYERGRQLVSNVLRDSIKLAARFIPRHRCTEDLGRDAVAASVRRRLSEKREKPRSSRGRDVEWEDLTLAAGGEEKKRTPRTYRPTLEAMEALRLLSSTGLTASVAGLAAEHNILHESTASAAAAPGRPARLLE